MKKGTAIAIITAPAIAAASLGIWLATPYLQSQVTQQNVTAMEQAALLARCGADPAREECR